MRGAESEEETQGQAGEGEDQGLEHESEDVLRENSVRDKRMVDDTVMGGNVEIGDVSDEVLQEEREMSGAVNDVASSTSQRKRKVNGSTAGKKKDGKKKGSKSAE